MTERLTPLTPPGCDLRDFPHTPLFRARLFGSSFHARANDSEWRAGVTLWLKSWDQVPAGSLPADDVELCRLAELARDLKTWGKLKAEALRGWVECSDGRLYHPVVAEGVNNAIEAKAKQRAKTAKARIAALEKHLKDAKTDADRERITDELQRLRQTMSQSLSQTLSLNPREGEGKEKGYTFTPPTGGGGDAAPTKRERTPAERRKSELWGGMKQLLVDSGESKDLKAAGAVITATIKEFDEATALAGIEATLHARPAGAIAYLKAACQQAVGQRQNKQEQLEAGNLAAAQRFAESIHATH